MDRLNWKLFFAFQMHNEIWCVLVEVWEHHAMMLTIYRLDEIHEIKSRINFFGGNDGFVIAFVVHRFHFERLVIFRLVDAAVEDLNPFDAVR